MPRQGGGSEPATCRGDGGAREGGRAQPHRRGDRGPTALINPQTLESSQKRRMRLCASEPVLHLPSLPVGRYGPLTACLALVVEAAQRSEVLVGVIQLVAKVITVGGNLGAAKAVVVNEGALKAITSKDATASASPVLGQFIATVRPLPVRHRQSPPNVYKTSGRSGTASVPFPSKV